MVCVFGQSGSCVVIDTAPGPVAFTRAVAKNGILAMSLPVIGCVSPIPSSGTLVYQWSGLGGFGFGFGAFGLVCGVDGCVSACASDGLGAPGSSSGVLR